MSRSEVEITIRFESLYRRVPINGTRDAAIYRIERTKVRLTSLRRRSIGPTPVDVHSRLAIPLTEPNRPRSGPNVANDTIRNSRVESDRVTDHVLEEHFQHRASLRKSDRIYVSRRPASETTDSRLGDALDVIAEHFPRRFAPPFRVPCLLSTARHLAAAVATKRAHDNDTRPCRVCKLKRSLGALATDATGDVLRHDGDAFGVYRAQIRIFEETDQVRLASLLEGHHGGALEPQVGLEVLRYLANESLKWQLTNQQLRALLVATDLAKGDSSRPVAVRLLHAAGGRCAFAGFVASCLRGALPPVDLRAVCFVRAMTDYLHNTQHTQKIHTNPRLLLTCDTFGYRGLYGVRRRLFFFLFSSEREGEKPIMGRPCARAHRVEAIASAHQWPSVTAEGYFVGNLNVNRVRCHLRIARVGRLMTVAECRLRTEYSRESGALRYSSSYWSN
ncbi:hypothetical protein EVAR_52540_1 [Eumeta japonica]|uniref:Uncharacterized protein n=1 Tax=Eumeta variegata TaxID=151549 RepID=A0A4C1ZNL6_EUMVA|nr:hypothetical protein EVAR_52540_1 [Eumeta japonica]